MIGVWIKAFRLRTLPLALSSIGMGTFLAALIGAFDGLIFTLCVSTTVFLQVLSNLANDYGDTQHGADCIDRQGPSRAVQSGAISQQAMLRAIIVFVVLSLVSGVGLLFVSLKGVSVTFYAFLALGIAAIGAAIKYTMGRNPYGYVGLGDISVLIFFGLAGVLGTYYLFTGFFVTPIILPALSCGFFATGVLNVNNIRDIESDSKAGKRSIPVRIGRSNAVIYHWVLLMTGLLMSIVFVVIYYVHYLQFLFVLTTPLFVFNAIQAQKRVDSKALDPMLKQLALSTLLYVILFGVGHLLALN